MDYELIEQLNWVMDDIVMKVKLCPVKIGLRISRAANSVSKLANNFCDWWLRNIIEEANDES